MSKTKKPKYLCEFTCHGAVEADEKVQNWCNSMVKKIRDIVNGDVDKIEAYMWFYREQGYDTLCVDLYDTKTDKHHGGLVFLIGEPHNFALDLDGGIEIEVPDFIDSMYMANTVLNTLGLTKMELVWGKRHCFRFTSH